MIHFILLTIAMLITIYFVRKSFKKKEPAAPEE